MEVNRPTYGAICFSQRMSAFADLIVPASLLGVTCFTVPVVFKVARNELFDPSGPSED
jgi:hypothetical protein